MRVIKGRKFNTKTHTVVLSIWVRSILTFIINGATVYDRWYWLTNIVFRCIVYSLTNVYDLRILRNTSVLSLSASECVGIVFY